ncbi:MAG: hypothetical protein CSA84_03020 [Actinomycetales bacterium]|nr:MAG: hypothetical protein CSA84_03020 [Actinomycetales bacterium]
MNTQHPHYQHPADHRPIDHRRLAAWAAVVVAAIGVIALVWQLPASSAANEIPGGYAAATGQSPGGSPSATAGGTGGAETSGGSAAPTTPAPATPAPTTPAPTTPGNDPTDDDLEPQECAGHDPGDGDLVATPNPLALPQGASAGSFRIVNCGSDDIGWTTSTDADEVILDDTAGTLGANATADVHFTVQLKQLDAGAFSFSVIVGEPGHQHEVTVYGFKHNIMIEGIEENKGILPGGLQLPTDSDRLRGFDPPKD